MARIQSVIAWQPEKGYIIASKNGDQQRIILKRKGFFSCLFDEIQTNMGNGALIATLRHLLIKLGAPDFMLSNPTVETLNRFIDAGILPISIDESTIEESIHVDGKSREVAVYGDTAWVMQTQRLILDFKKSLAEVMTENGARSIIRTAAKRCGELMGEWAPSMYGWKTGDEAMASQNEMIYLKMFLLAGWGRAVAAAEKDAQGNFTILVSCRDTFESEGIISSKPVCTILQSFMEGMYERIFWRLDGKSIESREVKCTAKGDDYCAFAFKSKDDRKTILDWEELESEWRGLDARHTLS